uniref:Uncharacterized protein n=1 Tax=Kalanchoe fedtschenkoi TaxID=63787 RepID=A0A7N0TT23_KALFE
MLMLVIGATVHLCLIVATGVFPVLPTCGMKLCSRIFLPRIQTEDNELDDKSKYITYWSDLMSSFVSCCKSVTVPWLLVPFEGSMTY